LLIADAEHDIVKFGIRKVLMQSPFTLNNDSQFCLVPVTGVTFLF